MASTSAPSPSNPDRLTGADWDSVLSDCLEHGFVTNFDPAEEILRDPVWLDLLEEAERDVATGKGVPIVRTRRP